jgi:hypothetical protein
MLPTNNDREYKEANDFYAYRHGGFKRSSINLLRLIGELEGCYSLTKYMAFDEDNAILDEMKSRYYKLYFKTAKEEKNARPD